MSRSADATTFDAPASLPELAGVPWRRRASARSLRHKSRLWTLTALAHSLPFLATAIFLGLLKPVTVPLDVILVAHGWIIPELYAARGAGVIRSRSARAGEAEDRALLLLGDLVGHAARDLHARTGLILERGSLGVWLLGEAGVLLVWPGGRRVLCFCVHTTDPELPHGDRIAHLLLALRTDELGFATVANLAFSGAVWRLRRRVPPAAREALAAAAAAAREPAPRSDALLAPAGHASGPAA